MSDLTSNEQSSLLRHTKDTSVAENVQSSAEIENGVPPASSTEESSNAKLALVLGSVWVG